LGRWTLRNYDDYYKRSRDNISVRIGKTKQVVIPDARELMELIY